MDLSSTKRQTASIIILIGGDGTDQEGRSWEISAYSPMMCWSQQ